MKLFYKMGLPCIALPWLCTPALADGDRNTELEEVIVSASRLQKPASALPNTVTIVDQVRIEQATLINSSLAGVLEQTVPGFGPSLDKLAGRGESLRGRNPLYLIDGVPQHNALRDGQRDGHTIDMDFVERIEVIHGSNAIQGIGATGGVINLVTKSPRADGGWTQDVKFSLSAPDRIESDGLTTKLSYIGSARLEERVDLSAGVTYQDHGLFYDAAGEPVGLYPTQGDIMDSTSRNLFLKLVTEPLPGQRLQLMVNDFNLERNGDFVAVVGDRASNRLTGTESGDPRPLVGNPAENDVTTVSLDYMAEDLAGWRLSAQLYYQDFAGLFEGGEFGGFFRLTIDGPAFLDQSEIQSEKYGAKLMLSRAALFDTNADLTLGLDLSSDSSAQILALSGREWVPEADLSSASPFVQLDYEFSEHLQLTAGARYENVDLEVGDYTTIAAANSTFVAGGEPEFTETLFNIGTVYDLTEQWSLYASFSEGFTMPDVGRVLRGINTPGQSVESFLDLEPVITDNREIGVKYQGARLRAELAVYQSDSDQGSRLDMNSNGIFEVRREKTEIEGIDINMQYALSDTATLGGNYAYIDGRFDADRNGSVDTDLDGLNIAPNRLNVFYQQSFAGNISARLDVSKLFRRTFKGAGLSAERAAQIAFDKPYTLAHFNISLASDIGDFALGLRNLLDKQYITYFSQVETAQRNDTFFAGQGRTLTLTYSNDF